MTKTTTITSDSNIDETVVRLEQLFEELNTHGMTGRSTAVWPVIIRRDFHNDAARYEYEYPRTIFNNIQFQNKIYVPFGLNRKKSDRLTFTKLIIDKHMDGEIDIFLYHFGMFLVYADYQSKDDFSEASIGKKRAQFVQTLPNSRFLSTDDFITAAWSYQIDYRDTDIGEHRRNPSMEKVRILFDPDQLASWTGTHYSNADWVEPISGRFDLECRKWTKEKDPMAPERTPEGWVEGHIVLEDTENGYKHYVCGVPVHAGSAIQVKFGDGWIAGRYEWSFDDKSPIRLHSGDDAIHINKEHCVRVRG